MKILFITTRHPNPPIGGDKLRAYHFLNHFLSAGHEVHLYSLEHGARNERTGAQVEMRFRNRPWEAMLGCIIGVFSPKPLQVWFFRNKEAKKAINIALDTEKYDIVFCHLLRSAQYIERPTGARNFIDLTDAISLNYKRVRENLWRDFSIRNLIYSLEYHRVLKYERALVEKFDRSFLISELDRNFLSGHADAAKVEIVPNGVDVDFFAPSGDPAAEPNIIFVGNLTTIPNRDAALYFAQEIFPLVRMKRPDAVFNIVGANPPKSISQLGLRDRSIRVSGQVPDVRVWMRMAQVSVAPMRYGAGVQNKILEAMSMGIPTVTTSIGLEGIPARPGTEILIGNSKEEFAAEVLRLLEDKRLRASVSESSRRFILGSFTWEKALRSLKI